MTESTDPRIELDLLPRELVRRRGRLIGGAGLAVAVLLGVLAALLLDPFAGVIVAVVLGVPAVLLGAVEGRRSTWLHAGTVVGRSGATRSVDLRTVARIELLVTGLRGQRTVAMLVTGPPSGRTVGVTLATYAGPAGRELGVLALRRLADALAAGEQPHGLVFAELLVAQLRAEAREEPAAARPLYRLATSAGTRLAHRITPEELTRFVTTLD